MAAKESTIQSNIINHLKERGCKVVNQHGGSGSEVGIPDLLVCYRGAFIGMEVKQPKAYPVPIQKVQLRRIREAGGIAGIVRSKEDADELLKLVDDRMDGRRDQILKETVELAEQRAKIDMTVGCRRCHCEAFDGEARMCSCSHGIGLHNPK